MADAKHGLILNLPGAPATPHVVYDRAGVVVPGWYHPQVPTPVGGDGDLSLDAAKALAEDPAVHLTLETMTAAACKAARDYWAAVTPGLRGGIADARGREPAGADAERLADEVASPDAGDYQAP